ncbi:MAG TPA: alpha/beta hydrolase, partial [Burkholderiaceae bacterium]|nr:alpha/beta hydrolase [Burkholderiaceae bacterium]
LAVTAAPLPAPAQGPAPPASLHGNDLHPNDVSTDLAYSDANFRNKLDLWFPTDVKDAPLVVFVHGGAWIGGNKEMLGFVGHAFAQAGVACAVLNYRLWPLARGAHLADDVGTAFAWLHAHARERGCDPDRMFLAGHSAGGHLAALLAFDPARLAALGLPAGAVKGFVGLSGVYDVRPEQDLLHKLFGRTPAERSAASPIVFAGPGAPPALLLWGEHDIPGLDVSARILLSRLQLCGASAAGRAIAGNDHVDYVFRIGSERDVIGPELVSFVRTRCDELRRGAPPPVQRPFEVDVCRNARGREDAGARIDVYAPRNTARARPLLLVRGGDDGDALARAAASWAARGLAVATLDLPLDVSGGERRRDEAVREIAAAAAWLRSHAAEFGADGARLALGGAGAGGSLALLAALDPAQLQAAGAPADAITAVIALGATVDPGAPARRDGPPALLLWGDRDAEAAADAAFAARLRRAAHEVLTLELPGRDRKALLTGVGTGDDELSPLVLGYLAR